MNGPPTAPPFRSRIPGLKVRGKAPTTPLEVLSVTYEDSTHHIEKQTRAKIVGGTKTWWVETLCRRPLVVTEASTRNKPVTCQECLLRMDPMMRPAR